jgi:hypothetical protein
MQKIVYFYQITYVQKLINSLLHNTSLNLWASALSYLNYKAAFLHKTWWDSISLPVSTAVSDDTTRPRRHGV